MRRLFAILPFITLLTAASPLAAATVPILPEDGRFTMAVTIDGHDLRFVVDSAAQSTFMAGEVARALGLAVTSDPQNGDSVAVKHYASGLFDRHDDTLALVQRTGMSVADGVVGMDLFAGQRIAYDFADSTFSAGPSGATPAGYRAIPATLSGGTLAIVDVVIDGVHAKALIDSGARRTVGNLALRDALGFKEGDARLMAGTPLPSPRPQPLWTAPVGAIDLGPVHIDKPGVAFSGLGFFKAIGLGDTPALLIGIDQLKRFRSVAIDYPRAELQIAP